MSKILLRGPCDINAISCYLKKDNNIVVESAFKGCYLNTVFDASISLYLKQAALNQKVVSPFVEPKFYPSQDLFDGKYDWVVISIIGDGILGIYENKKTHERIAYGLWTSDATKNSGEEYFDESVVHGGIPGISKETYINFANEYTYLGQANPNDIVDNLQVFFDHLHKNTKLIIMLGPENANRFGEKNPALQNQGDKYYSNLNKIMKETFGQKERIYLINPNDYFKRPIHKYFIFYYGYETINHYHIKTYYLLAKRLSLVTNKQIAINKPFYYKQLIRRNLKALKTVVTKIICKKEK